MAAGSAYPSIAHLSHTGAGRFCKEGGSRGRSWVYQGSNQWGGKEVDLGGVSSVCQILSSFPGQPIPWISSDLCQQNSWGESEETHWQLGGLCRGKYKELSKKMYSLRLLVTSTAACSWHRASSVLQAIGWRGIGLGCPRLFKLWDNMRFHNGTTVTTGFNYQWMGSTQYVWFTCRKRRRLFKFFATGFLCRNFFFPIKKVIKSTINCVIKMKGVGIKFVTPWLFN